VTVSEVFLGVIAVATLAMAVVQVGLLVAAGRLARRVDRLVDQVEHEIKPALGHLNAIGRDVSRAVAVGTAQVERADRLFVDLARKLDETLAGIQAGVAVPVREGKAFLSALSAALNVILEARRSSRRRQRAEDEDALFI
jgi:hypothetical protein